MKKRPLPPLLWGIIFAMHFSFPLSAQLLFQKAYGGPGAENNECMYRTFDAITTVPGSGYATCQSTVSYGTPQSPYDQSVYLLRLDSTGDTLFTKTYSGTSNSYGRSVFSLNESGFILGAHIGGTIYGMSLIRTDINGDTIWTRKFKTLSGPNIGYDGFPLNDGGFVACGESVYNTQQRRGCVAKVDANGNLIFGKTYFPANTNQGFTLYSGCETHDGGLLFTGPYWLNTASVSDLVVLKTDSAGNIMWLKTYHATADQEATKIAELPDHSIIVTGFSLSGGLGSYDVVLLKTDSAGNPIFEKWYGDSNYQWANSIAIQPNGDIVLGGLQQPSASSTQCDAMLIGLDQSGNVLWNKRYGGGGNDDLANSITVADDGNIIFSGFTKSFGSGNYDIYVVKTGYQGASDCYSSSFFLDTLTPALTVNLPVVNSSNSIIAESTNCTVLGGGQVTTVCTNLGLSEYPGSTDFGIYPNPSNGLVYLSDVPGDAAALTIYSLLGDVIATYPLVHADAQTTVEINLRNLPSGSYIAALHTDKYTARKLFILAGIK